MALRESLSRPSLETPPPRLLPYGPFGPVVVVAPDLSQSFEIF